jgi:hypothetical protein
MLSGKVFDLKTSVLNQPVDELPALRPCRLSITMCNSSRVAAEMSGASASAMLLRPTPVEDRNQRGGIDDDHRGKPFSS